jgi:Uncharacterized conserved protein
MSIIGFDIDDTVADGLKIFVETQNKFFNSNVTIEKIKESQLNHNIHQLYGLTKEEFERYTIDTGPKILPKLKPFDGIVEVVNHFYNEGHTIYFITARPEHNTKYLTKEWLDNNGFLYHQIYHDKYKVDLCKKLGISIFIDDHIGIINNMNQQGINCILVEFYKNNMLDIDDRIKRATNSLEIFNYIEQFIQEENKNETSEI